jgi:large repetitive protein
MRGMKLTRLAVAVLATAMAGCTTCGAPTEECDNVFITFDAPADGDTVNAPLDVSVTVADKGGNPLELGSATISTRLSSQTEFSVPTPGALEIGKATFGAVPMPSGQNLVRVSVQKANSQCSPVSKTIAVTVQDTSAPPEVTAFVIDADTNSDGILNSAELPANPAALNVSITTARGLGCQLAIKYMGNDVATRTIDALTVPVSIPAASLAGLVDAQEYRLLAQVSCTNPVRVNDPTVNLVATKLFGIDRVAPSCALLSPSKLIYGPSDDDDPATTGFQVRTLGQAGGDATLMQLVLSATGTTTQSTGPQSAAGGTLSRDFLIPNTGDTQYSVVLEVFDDAGNLCTVARSVRADFVAPQFTITEPTAGTKTSYNLPVTIASANENSSSVTVTTTPSGGSAQPVCGGTIAVGAFTCNGSFAAGLQTVSITVTDLAGNSTTQTVDITVTAPGCAVSFTAPAVNPALLTPRDDFNTALPDLQYNFVAASPTTGCGNKVARLLRNGTVVDTGSTDGAGVYRPPQRTEPDSNGVAITYRVEIDDGAGNTTFAVVPVTVNLQVPIVVAPINNSILNTERDIDNATAGVQSTLSYSPAAPTGFKAVACSSTQFALGAPCPDGLGGFILPAGDGIPTSSPGFTFPDGAYWVRMVFKSLTGPQTVSIETFVSNIQVESIRPVVTAFTFQGDANSDKHLRLSESASGDPVAMLTITGANGGTVVVRNRVTNTVVSAAPVAIASGMAAVPLPGLGASGASFEGSFADLVAEVTTVLGSKNMVVTPPPTGATLNAAAFSSLRVDRAPPTCGMTAPSVAQLGIADDADGVTAGYQVRVGGTVPPDVVGNSVLLEMVPASGTAQTQNVTPGAGTASHNFTVPGTGEVDYTARCTATDESGNVGGVATRAVRVDLVAPGCTLTAPNAGASPYTSSYTITTTATITNGNGLVPLVFTRVGAGNEQQIGQLPAVAGGTASGPITYPSGAQTVRVQVTDAAGNSCNDAAASQAITVAVPGCSLTWSAPATNPARLLRAMDVTPGSATTVEYDLTGTAGCNNQQMRFYRGSVGAGNELAGSPITSGPSGAFTFRISLPDSDGVTPETIIAEMNNGNVTTFPLTLYVDLTLPQVSNVLPAGPNVFVVSQSNSQLPNPSYAADTAPGTAGGQFTASLTVAGASGGQLSVFYQGGTNPISGPDTISSTTPTIDVTLPHNSTGSLVIRVQDASGNIVDTAASATVDVIAPGATTVGCALVAGKAREARVNATWTTSYDDGTDNTSGAVAKYDVRWTSELVAAGGLQNSADYFDSNKALVDALIDPPTLAKEVLVPPLVSTYCYVRARDEVFNYSPFPSTLPTAVANPGTRTTFANLHPSAAGTQQFGRYMSAKGSINNDALADLVVGYGQSSAGGSPDRVYVYYGAASGFDAQTPQLITATDATCIGLNCAFGYDVSMGNAGDAVLNDNKSDLLIGAPRAASSTGRAYLYFGTTGAAQVSATAANSVVFVGTAAAEALGRTAQIIGDINGDGLGEIMLSAPGAGSSQGRVYLFYGRPITGPNSWALLATGSQTGTLPGNPITMAQADRIFAGPNPIQAPAITNDFGRLRGGMTSIEGDFIIPSSATQVDSVFFWSSATVNAAAAGTTFTTGSGATPNQALQTLTGGGGTSGIQEGFGTKVATNVNLVNAAGIDAAIGDPIVRRVQIFADRTSGLFSATPFTTINGPAAALNFGIDMQAVDFSGDGRADLFIGDRSAAGAAYFLLNRGVGGSEFETAFGAGNFWYARLQGTQLGSGMASGDFDGNGTIDVAIADETDTNGRVHVWR